MRKIYAILDLDLAAGTEPKRGAGKIAKAIDRKTGGFIESGNQKGRGQMREVMFDMVDLRFDLVPVFLFEYFLDGGCAANVFDLLPHQFGMHPVGEHKSEPTPVVHTRFAVDCNMIDIARGQPTFAQTVIDRLRRQTSPVFDPAEPFFFGRGNQFSIDKQTGRGIAVISV